jgi:hypothetical protein
MYNKQANAEFDVVLHFDQSCEQSTGEVKKVTGLVKIKHLIPLIDKMELEANPRDAKVGKVTNDIRETLERTPELFPFKTKGILIGASQYAPADRQRYFVTFADPQVEGILDGGHNTMAIGLYVLNLALGDAATAALKNVKIWADFKKLWESSGQAIAQYRQALTETDVELDVLVPVELLVPTDAEDFASVEIFSKSLLDICAARNNNVQLKTEAHANQAGYFDALRDQLDASVSDRVEWRPNSGGDIKVADIVALAWIPLGMLNESFDDEDGRKVEVPSGTQIYSSKGECVSRFERLMSSKQVSETNGGNFRRDLKNLNVLSAFKITADLLAIYDKLYEEFPKRYNKIGGNFGRITAVKKMDTAAKVKKSKYFPKDVDYKYPEGFIIPLVYGMRSIIGVAADGQLSWRTDPVKFVEEHLEEVVQSYKGVIDVVNWDPQKVGKASVAYSTAENAFETAFLRASASK